MATKAKKKAERAEFAGYTTYLWKDKDPVIDVLRTAKQRTGMTDTEIANKTRVAGSTLKGWFNGETRSPKFATAAAVAIALGLDSIPITPEARRRLRGNR